MSMKVILISIFSTIIILIGVIFLVNTLEKEPVQKEKEEIKVGVNIGKDGKLNPSKINDNIYTEKQKMKLIEPKNKKLIAKNMELNKIKDEFKINYSIYETEKKSKLGEMKSFLIVFKNDGKKDFKQKMKFPCEYFLTIYETDTFLDGKAECKEEQEVELAIKSGENYYFMLDKLFDGGEKEKKIYIETPFDIKEANITVK